MRPFRSCDLRFMGSKITSLLVSVGTWAMASYFCTMLTSNQELKSTDSLDMHQLGRRGKHLCEEGNMQTKSIFEVRCHGCHSCHQCLHCQVTGAEAFKLLDKDGDGRLDKEETDLVVQSVQVAKTRKKHGGIR